MSWENIDYTFYTCKVYKLFFKHIICIPIFATILYTGFLYNIIVILIFIITHFLYTVNLILFLHSTPQCLSYFYTDI